MAPPSLPELLSVKSIGPDHYVSEHPPSGMGKNARIAYGGSTLGIAVFAAYKSVGNGFFMFSVLGSFLGPAKVDRKLYCRVFKTRDTKTFTTRRVVAYQIQDDKSERNCAEVAVDFHVQEEEMYNYGAPPPPQYFGKPDDPNKTATTGEIADRLLQKGGFSQPSVDAWNESYAMSSTFHDIRPCLDAVNGQGFYAITKSVESTQDHLPIHERSCAEWFRNRQPLRNLAEQGAALCFMMDGALSFLPLNLDRKDLSDAGACSTLDFALRIFVPALAINSWHLRERKTIAARLARTYSEARLWSEDGQLVAVMTQTNICRPLAKSPSEKANL